MKSIIKVLIAPFWVLLVVVIRGVFKTTVALGPVFSNHVRSTICDEILCPR